MPAANLLTLMQFLAPMIKRIAAVLLMVVAVAGGASGKTLKAYFTYCTFNSPENGSFVETYLTVVGSTVEYAPIEDGGYQGSIQVTLVFKQGEDIKDFKKYNLLSPIMSDTLDAVNFIDQQRIALPNGKYDFEIVIADQNSGKAPFQFHQELEVDYPADAVSISDIELLESFTKAEQPGILTKSGFDMVPYVSDYFPDNLDKISFYCEVYNSDKALGPDGKYLVNYYIEQYEKGQMLGKFKSFARHSAKPVNVVLSEFNISELPSGNYNLVVELRNRENDVLESRKLFFQRSNPKVKLTSSELAAISMANSFVERIETRDTIAEYIKSVRPISSDLERNFADQQLPTSDMEILKKFFLNFWMTRNSLNPELEWSQYQLELKKVDQAFGTQVHRGYETDRGRVYLQYGPPNTRTQQPNEPSAYPYEIWHYYKIGNFSNRKFVFYNPDLVSNNYELLHSDMFGEPNNYRWQAMLQKRNTSFQNIDTEKGTDHFGGRSDDLFVLPR